MRFFLLLLWSARLMMADVTLSSLAHEVRDISLDPTECYRIREINFQRQDMKFYLNEGYLIFSKPVNGRRISAVFSGDVEGGDAEFLVMPPYRGERRSLAAAAGTPNLNEHFGAGVMIFTDNTAEELLKRLSEYPKVRKSEEQGVLLASTYNAVVRNLASSFTVRIVHDLLAPTDPGIFFTTVSHSRLGPIDLIYDPTVFEQIAIGQTKMRNGQNAFEIWTSFPGRDARQKPASQVFPDRITDMELDSTLDSTLHMKLKAKAKIEIGTQAEGVLEFDISRRMHVLAVRVDGEPAEHFERENLRDELIRGREDSSFLVQPKQMLAANSHHEVEFETEGDVIADAGNRVYFVTSRGIWYPHRAGEFVRFDLTFRWPRGLDLVATGDVLEERTEGETKVSHRKVSQGVASVGFNLGRYQHATVTRDPYRVEVYANRQVEKALDSHPSQTAQTAGSTGHSPFYGRGEGKNTDLMHSGTDHQTPDSTARLPIIASEVMNAMDFFRANFGPPILPHITVSPIPGTFGQGFAGMLYLSTLSYLAPQERPDSVREEAAFFSDVLSTHETAHQWWGNVVTISSPQDEWIMESLANYSALLYLEKRKGRNALESALRLYKENLLRKTSGDTVESSGPIIWGRRLEQSHDLNAWRTITYDKGSWVIHMLRRRMGDPAFFKMLAELRRRYEFKPVTTAGFQQVAQQFTDPKMPDAKLDTFFDQWVMSTGIPTIQMNLSTKGTSKVSGEIVISDVDDDFLALVPIEIQLPKGPPVVQWVRAGAGTTAFSAAVNQTPVKVLLDPNHAVLRR